MSWDKEYEMQQRRNIGVPEPSALHTQVDGDHYKKLPIQVVEFNFANSIPYMEGNAIKYLVRWRDKGGIKDLEKAKHYIELLIEMETNRDSKQKASSAST